MQTIATS